MTDETCAQVRAWVEKGGTLLGFGAPGLFDEYGKRRGGLPLADVFGADLARLRTPAPVQPDKLYTGHPEGSYNSNDPAPRKFQFESNLTAALKVNTATPRGWYPGDDKEIAIATNIFGKGKALLCGYPLGYMYW